MFLETAASYCYCWRAAACSNPRLGHPSAAEEVFAAQRGGTLYLCALHGMGLKQATFASAGGGSKYKSS